QATTSPDTPASCAPPTSWNARPEVHPPCPPPPAQSNRSRTPALATAPRPAPRRVQVSAPAPDRSVLRRLCMHRGRPRGRGRWWATPGPSSVRPDAHEVPGVTGLPGHSFLEPRGVAGAGGGVGGGVAGADGEMKNALIQPSPAGAP